jgi:hypothetical protein
MAAVEQPGDRSVHHLDEGDDGIRHHSMLDRTKVRAPWPRSYRANVIIHRSCARERARERMVFYF